MFTSFLKITLRNLYREKMYAIINISGLSIAIACCLILGLWLHSELTYDRHNVRYKEIFRVVNEFNANGKINDYALTSNSLGPMLAEEYADVKGFVRILPTFRDNSVFRHGDDVFYWNNVCRADDNVFEVFTHDIIYGDPKTALVDPTSIAVSESFVRKYFGDRNPIGETISDDTNTYNITLVFADLPENTHLKYDVLESMNTEQLAEPDSVTARRQNLYGIGVYTYLVMSEGYDVEDFRRISDSFFERNMAEIGKSISETWRSWLQPLADVHFQTELEYDQPTGNKFYVYGFLAVAIFILLVACINYMNLATARATKRAKEVGMRKILGASRVRLVCQFLIESVSFTLISLLLALVLVEIVLNLTPLNNLLGKSLSLTMSHGPGLFGWMLVFTLMTGLIAGVYPALYLSAILPLPALVSGIRAGKGNIRLRQVLVLTQFVITVGVIACTLLMALQMRYISKKSLGFSDENKVIVTLRGADLIDKIPTIEKELSKNSNILGMTVSSSMIGQPMPIHVINVENNTGIMENTTAHHMAVGDNFLKVMGMQLASGRDFSKRLLTDIGASVVVNEAMVKKMGWDEPLGKRLQFGQLSRVIGVVKNFNFMSLHTLVEPFFLQRLVIDTNNIPVQQRANMQIYFIVNIAGEGISQTLSLLEDIFAKFDAKHPFQFEFLDDSLNQLYASDQRLMKLTGIFAGVCIFISCLGLFALAAFTTEQRTKEVGIRKVLGASTWQIIAMLSRGILLLVLGGAVIASVLSYFAMDEWLTGFAYHTNIDLRVFLVSAAVAAVVAFATVALQSFKTAQSNPVNALRYE